MRKFLEIVRAGIDAALLNPLRTAVTVACVVVRDGRLLMVEEHVQGQRVLNQPAGHLEPDESLFSAALRETLEQQVLDLGLSDVVRFLGHRNDVARLLAASDISVLTSLWEGLPRVLVQAAATGKPIVTFDVEGAWEVVRDGRNGFIVQSRDVDSFSQRLETLLADRDNARRLGQAGREQIGSQWTIETMLDRLDRLYQRLASRSAA